MRHPIFKIFGAFGVFTALLSSAWTPYVYSIPGKDTGHEDGRSNYSSDLDETRSHSSAASKEVWTREEMVATLRKKMQESEKDIKNIKRLIQEEARSISLTPLKGSQNCPVTPKAPKPKVPRAIVKANVEGKQVTVKKRIEKKASTPVSVPQNLKKDIQVKPENQKPDAPMPEVKSAKEAEAIRRFERIQELREAMKTDNLAESPQKSSADATKKDSAQGAVKKDSAQGAVKKSKAWSSGVYKAFAGLFRALFGGVKGSFRILGDIAKGALEFSKNLWRAASKIISRTLDESKALSVFISDEWSKSYKKTSRAQVFLMGAMAFLRFYWSSESMSWVNFAVLAYTEYKGYSNSEKNKTFLACSWNKGKDMLRTLCDNSVKSGEARRAISKLTTLGVGMFVMSLFLPSFTFYPLRLITPVSYYILRLFLRFASGAAVGHNFSANMSQYLET